MEPGARQPDEIFCRTVACPDKDYMLWGYQLLFPDRSKLWEMGVMSAQLSESEAGIHAIKQVATKIKSLNLLGEVVITVQSGSVGHKLFKVEIQSQVILDCVKALHELGLQQGVSVMRANNDNKRLKHNLRNAHPTLMDSSPEVECTWGCADTLENIQELYLQFHAWTLEWGMGITQRV